LPLERHYLWREAVDGAPGSFYNTSAIFPAQ
jgi:hypothetical protein